MVKKITAWRAAQRVVDDALPGNSDYAKARRIHNKFLDRFGETPVEQTLAMFRLAETGRRAQEVMAPMLEYLGRLRRSGDLEKVPLMWEDEQFMARYGDLALHEALERWNYLHSARGRRNYLQSGEQCSNKLKRGKNKPK
jgi:hypothetical protein